MTNASRAPIIIKPFRFYADGSGAPTTVECGGYVFAADYLGGSRLTLVRPVSGSRLQNEIAARRCEHAYTAAIEANAPAGWIDANTALYSEGVVTC